ncbi:MAG: class I SAM-dependent methyltransferase [Acidimicrobiales bacterium]
MQPRSEHGVAEAWDAIATRFDRYVTPQALQFGARVLDHVGVRPGMRLLDVAAGSGAVALPAAARGAEVVATDLAPSMLQRLAARARAAGLSTVTALVMDGTALQFPEDSFDIAVSLNGVSVFTDTAGGLREMARVTKPGGRVLVVSFGAPTSMEFSHYVLGALQTTVPELTPLPEQPSPLSSKVAEPGEVHRQLADAGLVDVDVEARTWHMHFSSGEHLWNVVTSSTPNWAALTAHLAAGRAGAVQQVLDGMLRERSGGGPGAVLDAGVNIGIGTKPTSAAHGPSPHPTEDLGHGQERSTRTQPVNQPEHR